jgi:hypothetical protein
MNRRHRKALKKKEPQLEDELIAVEALYSTKGIDVLTAN